MFENVVGKDGYSVPMCMNSLWLAIAAVQCLQVFQESTMNGFMSLGRAAWTEARQVLQRILSKDAVSL